MINGMPIFYSSKTGSGLKVVSTAKGFQPIQTKKGKGCNKNCNKNQFKGGGLKILK